MARMVINMDMAKMLRQKYDLFHATKCYTNGVGETGWYLDLVYNTNRGDGELFTKEAVHYRVMCDSFADCDVKRNVLGRCKV